MHFEDLSNKIPYAGKEISSKTRTTPEETSQRKNLSILPKEQSPASIELVKYNIENKTTPTITANYTSNKEKLNAAIELCEKDPKNIYNLACLKRLIDLYEPTLDPINSFLIKFLSIGPFGKANEVYKERLNELQYNEKNQSQILIKSFEETQWIDGLHLPEGLYSGPVKNGLPHTDKNSPDFSKGTLLRSNSMHYSGEFKEGKIDGKGIAVRPESPDKKEPPIKLEGLFEDGIFRGKIIQWNEGEYAGPTRSEKSKANGSFDRNTKDGIKFNGKGSFVSDEVSIFNGIFENDTLIEGTVKYPEGSKKEPLIVNRNSEPFAISTAVKWNYVGEYSFEIPHGENGVFYRDKDRWEGDFEDGRLITGSKVYENGTCEKGTFIKNKAGFLSMGTRLSANGEIEEGTFNNNQLEVGTRQEGNDIYSIDKNLGGDGVWKITDPSVTRTGTFKKIDDSYHLNGPYCRKDYTLNGIQYADVGTFENGIFKEGIRSYTNSEDVDVTEEGKFEAVDQSEAERIRTGTITRVDHGKKAVLTTLPKNDQWPQGTFLHLYNKNISAIAPQIIGHGSFEDESVKKEGYFGAEDLELGKLTIKDPGIVYETISAVPLSIKRKANFRQGKFRQGMLEGEGKITRPDGTSEEGKFRDNKLDGYGTKVFLNKKNKLITIVGFFQSGEIKEKEINNLTTYYAIGGKFNDDGNLDGEGIRKDGEYEFVGNFKDGKYDGIITFIDPINNRKHEYEYKNGIRVYK